MLAEWGVYGSAADKAGDLQHGAAGAGEATRRSRRWSTSTPPKDQGGRDIRINSSASSTAAFRKVAAGSIFKVSVPAP